jgi:hypothetical protein
MNRLLPALAAACFSLAAATAMAQSPSGDAGRGPMGGPHHGMKSCSQEADPAKCEATSKEMRKRYLAARKACKDKPGCVEEQFCAKETNKAQCMAKVKDLQERKAKQRDARQAAAETCTGKRGDELQKCMQAQHGKSGWGSPAQK